MLDTHRPRLFRKRRLKTYARRGEVYSWLRTYHDLVRRLLASGLGDWAALVEDMARDGVRGRDGAQLAPNNALKSWQRVCRDVGDTEQQDRPRSRPPSKIPRDWKPNAVVGPSAKPGKVKAWNPEEQLARLHRTLDSRSGRVTERE